LSARTLGVLVAVLVTFVALAFLGQRLERGSGDVGGSVGETFLPGLEADLNSIDRFAIIGPGSAPIATLERGADGWTVAEQDGYRADVAKIREALVALAEARILEEKTSNPAFYDRLGVTAIDDPEAHGLELHFFGGSRDYPAVLLGDASGTKDRFARRADEAQSYLIDRNPELATSAAQWTNPEILSVASDRVQRVEITHADGDRVVIAKSNRDQTGFTVENVPEGRELQYATIANTTGSALRELRLEAVARLGDTPPPPDVTSEFRTFDGLVVTAEGRLYGEEPWLSFTARFDAEQALDFADETVDENVAADADEEGADAEGAAETDGDDSVIAEAAAIEARVSGWRYRIAEYQYDQMTRRMADLLRAVEDEDASE